MKAEMRFRNYTVRTVAASLFAGLACLLILTGCPGTGSSHQGGGGPVYGGPSADTTSPASQAMNNINTGNINKLVELFTNGIGGTETASTVPMDFPAEDLWLPEDATIKITMSVNGVTTVYTSTAVNGNFHFDLPAVVTGSTVSVRMDVLEPNGTLMCTGRASKTVQGATDTLELTLSSSFIITLVPPAGVDAWVWLCNENPSDPYGWFTCSGDYPEYSVGVSNNGNTVKLGGLAVKNGVVYEIPTQDIVVGSTDKVIFTMNATKNFPASSILEPMTNGTPGAPLDRISCQTIYTDKKPALFDRADEYTFSVSPTAFYMSSDGGSSWASSFVWDPDDPWWAQMMGAISGTFLLRMTYDIKIDGTVVASGEIINPAS